MRERFELGDVHAVGGEGVIFRVRDRSDPAPRLLGKVALAAWHKPVRLTSRVLRRARRVVELEARVLIVAGCPYLPHCEGVQQFDNPLLEAARGGDFAKPEPCLVMERIGGQDLDTWLCRVHRGGLDVSTQRATFDRLVSGTLRALADLESRGYHYADLRPGNLRVVGRPRRRVRLVDAGSVVRADGSSERFPHVPSYLPPRVFQATLDGTVPRPSGPLHAAMAGRTLYEIATGSTPQAGAAIDAARLREAPVSPPVADAIARMAAGRFGDCRAALDLLAAQASRRG